MKNYILAMAAALGLTFSANAADPNRMLVVDANDAYSAYNIQNVSKVEFATVEGEVAANVTVKSFTLKKAVCSVTRTEACEKFIFNVIPGVIARQLEANPATAGAYLATLNSPTYAEDFDNGEVSGMDLQYGTEYAAVTVGIDMYNVQCDVRAAYFTTEAAPIVGDPKVNVSMTGNSKNTISLSFTPNSDVQKYWYVLGEKGTLAAQYEQFAGMFGYTNVGQMVQAWGSEHSGATTYTYDGLAPNTNYELYVQTTDKNGNMPQVQIFDFATVKQGGSGNASVEILVSDFGLTDWDGVDKPTQAITYKPNDQTWRYTTAVYLANQYDQERDEILAELQTVPDMPMAYWFQYEAFTNEYQIGVNTTCVAVACAQNADGKWGTPVEVRFTTPAVANAPAMPANQAPIARRNAERIKAAGMVPVLNQGIKLTAK